MLKDCKTKEYQKIAVATLEDTRKEEDLSKDGKTWLRGVQCNGGKIGNGQRQSLTEKVRIGSQSPQRDVAYERRRRR
jgi:hypothetical protein